ncbi:MAG: arsenate reductase family protein [Candidatus Cyclobacteriaceae bacterium M2_1C_046]
MEADMNAQKNEMKFFYNSEKYNDSKALGYAKTANKTVNVHDVSKEGLTQTQIAELAEKMNISVKELVDKNHELYLTDYKKKDLPNEEWLKLLEENPSLMKTPIAMTANATFYVDDPYKFVNRDMDHGGIVSEKANKDEK